jgi:hypothetical protein
MPTEVNTAALQAEKLLQNEPTLFLVASDSSAMKLFSPAT